MAPRGVSRLGATIALVALAACSGAEATQSHGHSTYQCKRGQTFKVERRKDRAEVHYAGRRFDLPRRASSIGDRYATHDATLIIDGDSAVFVTNSVLDLGACRAVD